MPEVSVIIPNYNHAAFLKERLDSVLQQTYQDFEVIILDDCSKDNSREIIESYRSHPKLSTIVYNESNSGSTFKQWEKGIALAKGKYIWIAESDDWCELILLETLMNIMSKNPFLVLGYVQSYYLVEDNKIKWIPQQDALEQMVDGSNFTRKFMLHGNAVFNASMAVFKKSAYSGIAGRYSNYKFCGDWLFWSDISRKGNVFISGKVLNYFRNHDGDVSRKSYSNGLNYVEELQVLFSFLDDQLISEEDFFEELSNKHSRYRLSKNNFNEEMIRTIDNLFYNDSHTKKMKERLLKIYNRAMLKHRVNYVLKFKWLWN
jgi:glycosyltransferase involved in cell wall biosynthesis